MAVRAMKYRVNYESDSRGQFVAVDEMHECHLVNAYRKALDGRKAVDADTLAALGSEVENLGLRIAFKGGKPVVRVVADVRVEADGIESFVKAVRRLARKHASLYRDGKVDAAVSVSAEVVNAYDAEAVEAVAATEAVVAAAS